MLVDLARCILVMVIDSHDVRTDGPVPRDARISYYWATGARAGLLLGEMAARREGEAKHISVADRRWRALRRMPPCTLDSRDTVRLVSFGGSEGVRE